MRRSSLLALVLFVALAGCDQFRGTERMAMAIIGPLCPPSAVLADAVTVTKLKPGSPVAVMPDASNVAFTAEMSKADIQCEYDMKKSTLTVDISFAVRASRGQAAAASDPPLDFFVAILDVEGNVLSKKVYQNQPELAGKPSAQWTQRINKFPVPIEMDKRPYDYEVLTGFQLSPTELAYNRAPKPIPQQRRP
jgi:hypothetical protein